MADLTSKIKDILSKNFTMRQPVADYISFVIKHGAENQLINTLEDLRTSLEIHIITNFALISEKEFEIKLPKVYQELTDNGVFDSGNEGYTGQKNSLRNRFSVPIRRENLQKPLSIEEHFRSVAPSGLRNTFREKKNTTFGFENLNLIDKQKKSKIEKQQEWHKEKFEAEEWQKRSKEIILTNWLKGKKSGCPDVAINNFSMETIDGTVKLLENTTIKLAKGMKYGLVGLNGIGKTTLLKNISRYTVSGIPKSARILHVEQEILGDDVTVEEFVLKSDSIREYLLGRKEMILEKLGQENCEAKKDLENELVEIESKILEFDVDSAETRAENILNGLGFSAKMQKTKTKELSGGWRMRVSLASALFVSPDILLLDEPTNHLDFPSVLWLEKYLRNFDKTVVIVSHDRNFLNNVVTHIVHMHNKQLNYYKGNYTTFSTAFQNAVTSQSKAYETQQNQIKHIRTFIDKFRYSAKRASMVQSRIKTLKKMDRIQPIKVEKSFKMEFPGVERLEKKIVSLDKVTFGYNSEKLLLDGIDLEIDCDSRIGLMGANGVGKSTLLKLIMGFYQPLKGKIEMNNRARIAYFTQHHMDSLDLEKSALENVLKILEDDVPEGVTNKAEYCRKRLGRFGISQDLSVRKLSSLSGGQKSRVAFCTLVWKDPHLLVLDEPTNHLDMETIDALIDAIEKYRGGLLIVSHDQYFLSKVAKSFWALHKGEMKKFASLGEIKKFVCGE